MVETLGLGDDKLSSWEGSWAEKKMGNVLFWSHLSVINALAFREGHRRLKITGS